jgi:hypothetical protein
MKASPPAAHPLVARPRAVRRADVRRAGGRGRRRADGEDVRRAGGRGRASCPRKGEMALRDGSIVQVLKSRCEPYDSAPSTRQPELFMRPDQKCSRSVTLDSHTLFT